VDPLPHDVPIERVRFTLLHGLAHHLIRAVDPDLYDQIDKAAGALGDPAEVEERVCQRFTVTLLVSDKLLDHVIGDAHPTSLIFKPCSGSHPPPGRP
jgi:Zn-dependent peptidase ImmA (M78 family)